MDGFSDLNGSLGYEDGTRKVEWNSLNAQRGIGKGKGSGIIHICYLKRKNSWILFNYPLWSNGYLSGLSYDRPGFDPPGVLFPFLLNYYYFLK